MSEAFSAAKQALVSATVLIHTNPSARISLAVDASDTHVGAVLQQFHNGGWAPLSFFSRKLDSAQSKYSNFDRELLAASLAVRHFRYMLEGRKFHIQTDHKPLIHALRRVSTRDGQNPFFQKCGLNILKTGFRILKHLQNGFPNFKTIFSVFKIKIIFSTSFKFKCDYFDRKTEIRNKEIIENLGQVDDLKRQSWGDKRYCGIC